MTSLLAPAPVAGESPVPFVVQPLDVSQSRRAAEIAATLERLLGSRFTVFDGTSGQLLTRPESAARRDEDLWSELGRTVVSRGRPEIIAEQGPLMALAVPLVLPPHKPMVGVATFLMRPVASEADWRSAIEWFGRPRSETEPWICGQNTIAPETLVRLAELSLGQLVAEAKCRQLEGEVQTLSDHLGAAYEEISLIYRLTQNLRISSKCQQIGELALGWLDGVLPVEGIAIQWCHGIDADPLTADPQAHPVMVTQGACPLSTDEFSVLIARLGLQGSLRPLIVNRAATSQAHWDFPGVRELIVVPLADGEKVFGWLAAFNHRQGGEFGTVEANLLSSVGTILGIHSANQDLYRSQSELLAGVVRAMTSAIDAKDPYTRGHSDRVARVAVRLAQELGCDRESVKTIYLSGLLHDIGKIGVDDNVLRKPGKLTDGEFEHIKTHVVIGHRILKDLRQMDHMLPVVLHHHEAWNGTGYPDGLAGEDIPLLARIVAVADAYDAMASDRPYRRGMQDAKLDAIMQGGAGQQWDAQIIEAFFRARDDIRAISLSDPQQNELDPLRFS